MSSCLVILSCHLVTSSCFASCVTFLRFLQQCVCNTLGTNRIAQLASGDWECDRVTGQCPCLPNVVQKTCDQCMANHWKLASGEGCEACDCDAQGSYKFACNEFDGTCHCKAGHGGRRCNECQANHWGDPRVECYPCDCSSSGSAHPQCDRQTGACQCVEGIDGHRVSLLDAIVANDRHE